ncbi:hypothetical protein [Modicisalibacter muralis]|uniref:hypothetical protein n=1 Tax=Modicisalibacter muralis TaxID=119000 RepID=UPI000B7F27E9|nr:hypothetical protein [Halomonas muralis]
MVGDSYNDYRAARSNGTRFIGVLPETTAHSPFPAIRPACPICLGWKRRWRNCHIGRSFDTLSSSPIWSAYSRPERACPGHGVLR